MALQLYPTEVANQSESDVPHVVVPTFEAKVEEPHPVPPIKAPISEQLVLIQSELVDAPPKVRIGEGRGPEEENS